MTCFIAVPAPYLGAITLFEVLSRNWEYLKEKDLFLDAWDADDLDDIKNWLDEVSSGSLNLVNFGVKKEEIPNIVKLATTGGRMDNNPIIFDEKEIYDILNNVY